MNPVAAPFLMHVRRGRGSLRGDEQGEAVSDMKGEKADDERNGWGVSEWIHALAAQSRGGAAR